MTSNVVGGAADFLLFCGSLAWLADFTLLDFLPGPKKLQQAIHLLKNSDCILNTHTLNAIGLPTGRKIVVNKKAFDVLAEFHRQHFGNTGGLDWTNVVGIGRYTINMPTPGRAVSGFEAICVLLQPETEGFTELRLLAVAQMQDVHRRSLELHQRRLNIFVGGMLSFGFLIQIYVRFFI